MSLPKVGIPKVGIALLAICASMAVAPVAALAQSGSTAATAAPTTTLKSYKATGQSRKGHKKFTGRFTINRFATKNGKTYAVGTLTGRLGHRSVKQTNVFMPAKVQRSAATTAAAPACPVLHLVLGPLHLDLLGLVVDLNQVVLNIQAQPGPGNLLGNLVCAIANLLNGTPAGAAQTSGLLTIFQQLVNNLGLLQL